MLSLLIIVVLRLLELTTPLYVCDNSKDKAMIFFQIKEEEIAENLMERRLKACIGQVRTL